MDGSFVNAIAGLAQEAAGPATLVDIDGATYSTVGLHRLPKEHAPDEPAVLTVHSLQALVDYIAGNRDGLRLDECMLHIASPSCVDLVSKLQPRAVRFTHVRAVCEDLTRHFFDQWHTTLEATIALQSLFEDDGHRAEVLRIIGGVADQSEVRNEDDGRTQTVSTRAGVKVLLGDEVKVPNPVLLAPFRTFRELTGQPVSPFVFRMERGGAGGVRVAFFEADGGKWKLEAIGGIAAWLRNEIDPAIAILA